MSPHQRLPLHELEGLLDVLRDQGFRIPPEEQFRITYVCQILPIGGGGRSLSHVLPPLIARSAEEQAKCRHAVETYLRGGFPPDPPLPRLTPEGSAEDTHPRAPARALEQIVHDVSRLLLFDPRAWREVHWFARVGVSLLLLPMSMGVFRLMQMLYRGSSEITGGGPGGGTDGGMGEQIGAAVSNVWVVLGVVLLVSILLFAVWTFRPRSRPLGGLHAAVQREKMKDSARRWPLLLGETSLLAFRSEAFLRAARELRRRESTPGELFDLEASVRETVRALGYPALRFRQATRPPEYVALVERESPHDQQAQYFADLCRHLRAEGVHLDVWSYEGDPRVVRAQDNAPGVPVARLRDRHAESRWLLFGTGHGLLDPVFGDLLPWADRLLPGTRSVILSPEPPSEWGAAERTLASHFVVVPATLNRLAAALQELGAQTPSKAAQTAADDGDFPDAPFGFDASIEELRTTLEPRLFTWVAACAVFPELNWRLTLRLGTLERVHAGGISEADLLVLVRLPWFRTGVIPDRLRLELLDTLDADTERAVRLAILGLLDEALTTRDDPAKAERLQADRISQRLLLCRDDPEARAWLADELLRTGQPLRDAAVVRLLRDGSKSRLSFLLPPRLTEYFTRSAAVSPESTPLHPTPPAAEAAEEGLPPSGTDQPTHPQVFRTLFFAEMWERFAYYGLRPLLVLFMASAVADGGFGLERYQASSIVGIYGAGVYLASLPGGWVADRILGAQRAVRLGALLSASGHALIIIAALAGPAAQPLFFLGMLLVVLGTGLFKPNVTVLVGELHSEGASRRDARFLIFYVGINLGALAGQLVTGFLGEQVNWAWGFAAAGVGMLLSLLALSPRALGSVGREPFRHSDPVLQARRERSARPILQAGIGFLCLAVALVVSGVITPDVLAIGGMSTNLLAMVAVGWLVFLLTGGGLTKEERMRTAGLAALLVFAAVYWSAFEQAPTSLNFFASDFTDREFGGAGVIPSAWFQSLSSVFVIVLAPAFAALWIVLGRRGRNVSASAKFALGFVLTGAGFFLMFFAANRVLTGGSGTLVSPWWLVASFLLQSAGELCLSPIGMSAVSRHSPRGYSGQMMALWFMASALAILFAGLITGPVDPERLEQMPGLFLRTGAALLVATVALVFLVLLFRRLLSLPQTFDKVRMRA